MRRLPTIDPPTCNDSLQSYGCKILTFVLQTGVTATLSDSDLELADHVYPLAVSAHDISPLAVDKLSAVRHQIMGEIKARRAELAAAAIATPVQAVPDTPNGTHKVRLVTPDRPLAPVGALADRPF